MPSRSQEFAGIREDVSYSTKNHGGISSKSELDYHHFTFPRPVRMANIQIYNPLSPSRKEIRLLEIFETSPVIKCQLSTASLVDGPEFCTLSYVWGKQNLSEEIHANGVPIKITKSLADALRHIQMQWQRATKDQDVTKLRVWADALCINQNDTQEKNWQVPLMKDIYSSANLTFCCLDSVSETSTLPTAIRGLSAIAARIVESDFDPEDEDEEVDFDLLDNLPSFENLSLSEDLASSTGHSLSLPSDTDRKAKFWAANRDVILSSPLAGPLRSFTHLPYWRRAWIFQEITLSKRSILFYADNAIDFQTLATIFQWANKAKEQSKPEKFPWRSEYLIQLLNFQAINNLSLARNGLALQKSMDGLDQYKNERAALLVTIHDLLGSRLEATHPKDHIYALLGVTGLEIVPRYGEETTVASVYTEFCIKQLEAVRSSSRASFSLLHFSGLANGNPGPHALPTWVPNFPACAIHGFYHIGKLCEDEGERNPSMTYASGGVENVFIRDQSLFTTSLSIDTIEVCSQILSDSAEFQSSYTDFAVSVFKILRALPGGSPSTSATDEIHPFLKLTSAFCHARVEEPAWLSPQVTRVARMLQAIVMGMSSEQHRSAGAWTAHQTFLGEFTAAIFCGLEGEEALYGDSTTRLSKALVAYETVDKESFIEPNTFIRTFRDVQSFSKNGIRVARTTTNELVLVPPQAEQNDEIVLIADCKLCLIRKKEDHYEYIGPVGIAAEVVDSVVCRSRMYNEDPVQIELR